MRLTMVTCGWAVLILKGLSLAVVEKWRLPVQGFARIGVVSDSFYALHEPIYLFLRAEFLRGRPTGNILVLIPVVVMGRVGALDGLTGPLGHHEYRVMFSVPERPYLHLIRKENQVDCLGVPRVGLYQDIASPTCHDGVFLEWSWDGAVLRFQNCLFGLYPLYYHATAEEICLSTDLMRLLAEGVSAELDDAAFAFFLRRGFCAGNDTPFRSIRILPPNSTAEWRPGRGLRISGGPPVVRRQNRTRSQAMEGLNTEFRSAIRRRAPRGEFVVPLSGGRDSRHVLLELVEAGYRPQRCLTARHFPPLANEDARIAALVAAAVGVEHTVLDAAPSLVERELRKNPRMNYATDWSAWHLAVLDALGDNTSHLYAGYGGDTVTRGIILEPKRMELWLAGQLEELATYMMGVHSGIEPALRELLKPEVYERFSPDLARDRLLEELHQHVDQPNPDLSFVVQNALRRRTCPQLFPLTAEVTHVYVPFMDASLYAFLASLPLELLLDKTFHTEAIHAAYPAYRHVPFEAPSQPGVSDQEFFRRFARESSAFVLSRGHSDIFEIRRILERFSGCRTSGDHRMVNWFAPQRILGLLQLEAAVELNARRSLPSSLP